MAVGDLVLALTGASGMPYGIRLLEVFVRLSRWIGPDIHLTISPAAAEVLEHELQIKIDLNNFHVAELLGAIDVNDRLEMLSSAKVEYHHFRDFRAGIASGSFLTSGMVICPCSMGTVAAIAHGLSQNLIHRAADVHLKERRKLILVPRETPLNIVQLRNLTVCAEAGAVILPAMPAFYHRPQTLDDQVNFIVARICDQLGVEHGLGRRWGEK